MKFKGRSEHRRQERPDDLRGQGTATRTMKYALFAALSLVLSCGPILVPPDPEATEGEVIEATPDHVRVRTLDGKEKIVTCREGGRCGLLRAKDKVLIRCRDSSTPCAVELRSPRP